MTGTDKAVAVIAALVVATIGVILSIGSTPTRVVFRSCAEAREAGAPLPLHQGDPGWNPKLDRDHDGQAC